MWSRTCRTGICSSPPRCIPNFYANANYGFADPNDPDPKVPFGHLHADSAEWWMVMVGHISGRFESGEVVGSEGDILYAPPFMWHQMGNRGAGPSCRLTFGAYDPVNFNYVAAE